VSRRSSFVAHEAPATDLPLSGVAPRQHSMFAPMAVLVAVFAAVVAAVGITLVALAVAP